MKIAFHFRWPVRQASDTTVEMVVPAGDGPAPLNHEFCKEHNLSDAELMKAECAVIRAIAIIE